MEVIETLGATTLPKATGRIAVLGGGPGGLAAADLLCRKGFAVTVIEAADRLGGTLRSVQIGPYTFDTGSIFLEERAALFGLDPDLRERCPSIMRRQRRIDPQGGLRAYPFVAAEVASWSRIWQLKAALDVVSARISLRRDGTLETICRQRMGDMLYRTSGLRNYICRFNHLDPSQIHDEFFFHRMSFVERATRGDEIFRLALRQIGGLLGRLHKTPPRRPLHIRPQAGFGVVFDPIQARLTAAGVRFRLGEAVHSLRRFEDGYLLGTTAGVERWDAVVSAIPADTLHRAMFGIPSGLQSVDMTTLFVSAGRFASNCGNVLYNFHGEGRWKRATIYSDLYPDAETDRAFFSVEVTQRPGDRPDPEADFQDFARHVEGLGLAGDLRLEGQTLVPAAYPLYRAQFGHLVRSVIDRIAATGVVPVGRQGRFEYLPTSSGVMRRVAEEIAKADLCVAPAADNNKEA